MGGKFDRDHLFKLSIDVSLSLPSQVRSLIFVFVSISVTQALVLCVRPNYQFTNAVSELPPSISCLSWLERPFRNRELYNFTTLDVQDMTGVADCLWEAQLHGLRFDDQVESFIEVDVG